MAMASSSHLLNALPIELLVFIIDGLDRVEDIASLALTNRRLYSTANPLLYKRAALYDDARALAWAANRGLVSTLRMALAAGVDPNHEFIECLPAEEWERVSAAARADLAAGRPKARWAMWDYDNRPRAADAKWSPEPPLADGGEDADTPTGTSTDAPTPRAPSVSDQDSVISSEEEDLSQRSDATPATEPSPTPTPDTLTRRYNAIHLAARGGHNDILELLLRHGAAVNVSSERFCACTPVYGLLNALECPSQDADCPLWTPLHAAICHAHTDTAKLLLVHKASPLMETLHNSRTDTSTTTTTTTADLPGAATALHHAAGMGLTTLVQHILTTKTQTDINVRDTFTTTPFYHAYAARRWSTTVPLLLELGADMHCEIKMYIPYTAITPLGEACRLGDFDAADRLLEMGADPRRGFVALTSGGCLTPLHMCCMRSAKSATAGVGGPVGMGEEEEEDDEVRGRARMATIQKLIARGAKVDAQDCFGDTPRSAAEKACNTFALEALAAALSISDEGDAGESDEEGGKPVDVKGVCEPGVGAGSRL